MIREAGKPGKTENTEGSALDVRMRGSAGGGGGKQVGGVLMVLSLAEPMKHFRRPCRSRLIPLFAYF